MSVLQVHLVDAEAGEEIVRPGPMVVYDAQSIAAQFHVDGRAVTETAGRRVVWSLVADADPDALLARAIELPADARLIRGDRVDFPGDGVAFLHTHQGPGIRVQVEGAFAVESLGERLEIDTWDAWFEGGPDPVYAEVRGGLPAAFVRVMVLPATLIGTPSIRYVRDEDRDRPKSQRYTVFVDEPL
jgi:hypothetical protein